MACPVCEGSEHQCVSEYKSPDRHFLSADSIVRCDGCGLVFASPRPSDEEIDRFYKEGSYHDEYQSSGPGQNPFFLRLAQSRAALIEKHPPLIIPEKCLDVGGGYGIFGRALKERFPNVEYHIVEPGQGCRQAWGGWVAKPFADLAETEDGLYELAALNQVLEHVGRPVDFLLSVIKKMRPGGRLFIETPFRDDLYKASVDAHLIFWEPDSLKMAVERAGLKTVYCDSVGMTRTAAYDYFNHRTSLIGKLISPWAWMGLGNKFLTKMKASRRMDTSGRFKMNEYGGDRQWIRCIAEKTEQG